MSKYNSPLHQNITVWARRLDVNIKDLDNAVAYAQFLCSGHAGRRGALTVVLIKPLSKLLGRGMKDDTVTIAAIAAANVIYDTVYNGVEGGVKDMFFKNMSNTTLQQLDVFEIISNTDAIIKIIEQGISSRGRDRSTASVTDKVLRKLKY